MTNRHHYLPEFYIKGFVNSENKVYVYDKAENKLKKKLFSPKQIFFEWNRNTLHIEKGDTDFIEELYAFFEAKIAPVYNRVKSQSGSVQYYIEDVFYLLILVSLTYYRLPKNDKDIEKFISSSSSNELLVKTLDKESNQTITNQHLYNEMRNKVGFTEIYKLIKPLNDFMLLDIHKNIENWRIASSSRETSLHLLGDSPIVFKDKPSNNNILETQLVFPLTNNMRLYYHKGKKIQQIKPEYILDIDIMIFLQSERYVVGANKEYLDVISKLAQEYNDKEKIEFLRSEIFKIFD
ncbi:DUF4238 domain-containing protein [Bernardetia sp. ABR2-2B]|uniref:DUF4238 domain-containing protein n=1 Tax=Bernardetia sp. ABR2-2B TaxID=3127472 RepID=UPI0030D4F056